MNTDLQKLAVRIRNEANITVGSGLLYLTNFPDRVYVITAAHIFDHASYPLTVQCYPDENGQDDSAFSFSVSASDITIPPAYISATHETGRHSNDTALIRIPRRPWMNSRCSVLFGDPYAQLRVEGFGFASNNREDDIRLDIIPITQAESRISNVTPRSNNLVAILKGDFEINQADREHEVEGMSGTVITAANQAQIIAVGIAISIPSDGGLLGRFNLIDMCCADELLHGEGIDCSWQSIGQSAQQGAPDTFSVVSTTRNFVHRNNELSQIQDHLSQHRIVVLSGMGGIGKTALARHYAATHSNEYTHSVLIPCSSSIAAGIASHLQIDGVERRYDGEKLEDDIHYCRRLLDALKRFPQNKWLLILDNAAPSDPLYEAISTLAQHKIITSRWDRQSWICPVMDISALSDLASQKDLFEKYLDRRLRPEELEDFHSIAAIVSAHTLTLQLVALQCAESDMSISEIRAALEADGVYTENPDLFPYGETLEERNMYGHIRSIWNLSNFSANENRIMQGLSLLSPNGITRREYKQWLELGSMHDINQLRRQGWIQTSHDNGKELIYLHSVIGEVIFRELYAVSPAELSSLYTSLGNVINTRTFDHADQLRYISYGICAGKRIPPSEASVTLLNLTGLHLEYFNRLDSALELLFLAESQLHELGIVNTQIGGCTYNNIAVVYQSAGQFSPSITYYQKSIDSFQHSNPPLYGNTGYTLHNIAKLHYFSDDIPSALSTEDKAEKLIKQHNKPRLGEVYDLRMECFLHKTWELVKQREELIDSPTPNQLQIAAITSQINSHIEKAISCGKKAIHLKKKYNPTDEEQIKKSLADLACIKSKFRNDPQSKTDIHDVLDFFVRTTGEQSIQTGETYSKMCMIYENLGDAPSACRFGETALEILTSQLSPEHESVQAALFNLQVAQKALYADSGNTC